MKIAATYQRQADGRQHPPDVEIGSVHVHDNGYGTIQLSRGGSMFASVHYRSAMVQEAVLDAATAYEIGKKMASALDEDEQPDREPPRENEMAEQTYMIVPSQPAAGKERMLYCLRHASLLLDVALSNLPEVAVDFDLSDDELEEAQTYIRKLRNFVGEEYDTWKGD